MTQYLEQFLGRHRFAARANYEIRIGGTYSSLVASALSLVF